MIKSKSLEFHPRPTKQMIKQNFCKDKFLSRPGSSQLIDKYMKKIDMHHVKSNDYEGKGTEKVEAF